MGSRTTAPPRRRARSIRLGAKEPGRTGWGRVVPMVLAFALGGILFGGGGYLAGRPSEAQREADSIRQADAARDERQITQLTDLARTTRDALAPVLSGLNAARPATAAEVTTWQRTADAAAEKFDDPPSGTTATNVARGSLAAAVDQLAAAVRTYALSLAAPDGTRLREVADEERDIAVTTWSVGATQLDQINIDAGHGHQHVYLSADPESGAFTPDDAPEGSGRR